VHGPLARTVEDAAMMLDAMIGFSRLSPISVAPPWKSALEAVERATDAKGLRIAYAPDIAGIGVDSEIDAICRRAVRGLHDTGATVEPVAFDVSDGRDPYQTWRGAWMVGQQISRLSTLAQFGANLKGNIEAGLKVTALDLAKAEETRQRVFHRFRELFDRYDVLMTPAAPRPYPVTMNFPREINGQTFENYIDWIAPAFLVTLVSLPAGSVPAGKTSDGLPVGLQIVAPRFEEPRILSLAKFIQQANPIGSPPDIA
jgi:amidase